MDRCHAVVLAKGAHGLGHATPRTREPGLTPDWRGPGQQWGQDADLQEPPGPGREGRELLEEALPPPAGLGVEARGRGVRRGPAARARGSLRLVPRSGGA
jgi:hypothetical protein